MNRLPNYRTLETLALLRDGPRTTVEIARIRGKQPDASAKVCRGLTAGGYAVEVGVWEYPNPRAYTITQSGRDLLDAVAKRHAERRAISDKYETLAARVKARYTPAPKQSLEDLVIPATAARSPWGRWMYIELVAELDRPGK